jgi:hypothetical protein
MSTLGLCADGLACETTTDASGVTEWPGVCVAMAAAGAVCGISVPSMCPFGQYCETSATANSGTCVTEPTAGQACGQYHGLAYVCAAGSVCVNKVCAVPKANSESCSVNADCASSNCAGGVCAARLDCSLPSA